MSFGAIAADMPSALPPPMEKVTVAQFGKARFLLYLPLYVAMEEGLFKKRGLDVDLKFAGNDDQVFATVIGGSADFGVGDPVFAALSHDKGGPGKVIAMMIEKLGVWGVTNNPKIKPITDLKQLDGLRLSSFARPSTTYTLLEEIKQKNKLKNMKIVEAAFGAQIALLESGNVDIANDIEPSVSVAEDKGYPVVFSMVQYMDPQVVTGITTTEETLKKRPQVAQKFVESLQEALDIVHRDPQIASKIGAKLFADLKPSVLVTAQKRMVDGGVYPKSVVVQDALWQRSLKTRLDSGDLKNPQVTSVAVDNSFAQKVQADAGGSK